MIKKFIKSFIIGAFVFLFVLGGIVFLLDPFYHFHKPLFGMKPVLNFPEYQVIGTLKNFDYDSVILGSSMAENFDNHDFDEAFSCTSVKAIKTGGSTSDLIYFLNKSFEYKKLRNVFYSLDVSALCANPNVTFLDNSMPLYLYDNNPFNDIQYLFNKDVIFQYIPYMLALSLDQNYNPGESYSFAKEKNFSRDDAIRNYARPSEIAPPVSPEDYTEYINANVAMIEDIISAHPETAFYIYIPPYSCLWWDNMYRQGCYEEALYATDTALTRLSTYDNVYLYSFLENESIANDLNHYMDTVHFDTSINKWIIGELANKKSPYRVDSHSLNDRLAAIRAFAESELTIEW